MICTSFNETVICYLSESHLAKKLLKFLCFFSAWTDWTVHKACSVTCGTGIKEFLRTCSTGQTSDCTELGGKFWDVRACDAGPCINVPAGIPKNTRQEMNESIWY